MATQDEYIAARERFEAVAATLEPAALFRLARQEGYGRLLSCILLRDFYGMNLTESMAIDAAENQSSPPL